MKTLRCRDFGQNCDAVIRGNTDDEVMNEAVNHGRSQHGLKDVTSDIKNKIKSLIKSD